MKIAVGYVRCSTDMQDDSVHQQKYEIQKWADVNEFKIIEWFEDEGKSGTSFDRRPAFLRLIRRVETRPNFNFILVYDESRWGRPNNPRENTYWKVHAERFAVKVRIINSSSKNENDIGSFVTEVVESAEASEYSKKLSKSTLRGSVANAQRGFSSGGTAPYGYVRIAVSKDTGGKLRVLKPGEWMRSNMEKVTWDLGDPLEVSNVKRMFELKASGLGYVAIADLLNREGIACPRRGRWRNSDMKWSGVTVRGIVTNKSYCGIRIYNVHPQSHIRYADGKKKWVNNESEWVTAQGAHPAIITEELFNKATMMNKKSFATGRAQAVKSEYLLSGLIRCGSCGFNFSGQRYFKDRIFYYQDSGYINKGRSVCSSYLIRKEKIEDFVIQTIKENLLTAGLEPKLQGAVERQLEQRLTGNDPSLERIEQAIAENDAQLHNLVNAIASGINIDTIIDRVKNLEKEKEQLKHEREKLKGISLRKEDIKELAREIMREVHGFERSFDSASIFEKKRWIRRFVRSILVDREANRATCTITKIPMLAHPILDSLITPGLSIKSVAGTGLEPATFGL